MNRIFEARKQRVSKYQQPLDNAKIDMPDDLYLKCPSCGKLYYAQELHDNLEVCPYCGHHHSLRAEERIEQLVDTDSFTAFNYDVNTANPLDFPNYAERVAQLQEKLIVDEAVIAGTATIGGYPCILAIMDNAFLMGSMGTIVGDRITAAIEYATAEKLPVIVFSTSGGARMQEGLYSLMQMAKTSAALARHDEAGGLYISVITNPTTGGVSASFAMLGDIIIAEPDALIGFAGPRVIKNTIKQDLPEGFQTSEFLQEHGFLDRVVPRQQMRGTLTTFLAIHHVPNNKTSCVEESSLVVSQETTQVASMEVDA